MNIAIEAQVLNHHQRSGLMTYTEGLVRGQYALHNEHRYSLIYYSVHRNRSQMPGPGDGSFRKDVLRIPDRLFPGRQKLLDGLMLPHYLRSNKIEVFHRPSGYTMPAGRGYCKILTVHDLRTLTIGDTFLAQNIAHYRKTLNDLDVCVVVSECTKQDLLKHFQMDERKIKVIYLGADKRFQPALPEALTAVKAKYQIQEPFLLSVGSVPRKNIPGIIRGFAGSRYKAQYLLVLACNMDVQTHLSLAKELGIENRVRVLSRLSDEEVVALYSSCHCFVFPSLYEGFGLPILEAMQCGAPVITANLSSCPEVAGDAAILVNPHSTVEISDAINQICGQGQLRGDLMKKGFERAKQFSWDNYAREMKKIYETCSIT